MKLWTRWMGAVALVCIAGTNASAQIAGSAHNFSSYGWSGGEICKPCHTPHFAIEGMPRLWNHELTTATYTMFEGETGTAVDNFDYASRMCMSCHDGTVALDSFGGQTGTTFIQPRSNLGIDLTDDHPVGSDAVYPADRPTSFNPPSADGRTVTFGGVSLRLKSWDDAGTIKYVVGCTTCHNAHNRGGYPHMTQSTMASSQMCLVCHIK
ncbi:MAG: hypothetical protein IT436_04745 [Phycisphaerales bacterium]|nr:hypothetical protein [Phycisphaerales bacterium]